MYKIMVKLNTQSPNMYQVLTVNGEEYIAETLEEVKEKAKAKPKKDAEAEVQKVHDKYIKKIDDLFAAKEKEIMTV